MLHTCLWQLRSYNNQHGLFTLNNQLNAIPIAYSPMGLTLPKVSNQTNLQFYRSSGWIFKIFLAIKSGFIAGDTALPTACYNLYVICARGFEAYINSSIAIYRII